MRKPLIMANWKSHGSYAQAKNLCEKIIQGNQRDPIVEADVGLGVPFPYLSYVSDIVAASGISVAAQNCSQFGPGAYTGEVTAAMLAEVGARAVILGHSERRELFEETDAVIADKVVQATQAGLQAILCVGETLAQRRSGMVESILETQLHAVLTRLDTQKLNRLVIAYEPVWAIGTGHTPTSEQINTVHGFIRKVVANFDPTVAKQLKILYGGSVKAGNAGEILALPEVDGGLIGGASLKAADFIRIMKQANGTC